MQDRQDKLLHVTTLQSLGDFQFRFPKGLQRCYMEQLILSILSTLSYPVHLASKKYC